MSQQNVWIFFYGTFMCAHVLNAHGIDCETTIPAKITGFSLTIRPRVNLQKESESIVYGGLACLNHIDIARLYEGLRNDFGVSYFPCAVLVEMFDGTMRPALCYVGSDIPDAHADPVYIQELASCARLMNAPETYIRHIQSFGIMPINAANQMP